MQLCSEEKATPETTLHAGRRLFEAQAADRSQREALTHRLYRRIGWLRRSELRVQLFGAGASTLLLLAAFGVFLVSHPPNPPLPLLWTLIILVGALPLAALGWTGGSTCLRDRIQGHIAEFGAIDVVASGEGPVTPWICPGCWERHGAGTPPVCSLCLTPRPSEENEWQEQQLGLSRDRADTLVHAIGVAVGLMLVYCMLGLVGCFVLPRF